MLDYQTEKRSDKTASLGKPFDKQASKQKINIQEDIYFMFEIKQIWQGGDGYDRHRIPGMIVTKKGTLIVYHEARMQCDDWSMMDILMQRSCDKGETFSEFIKLAAGNEEHHTVNNPVMLEDKNGRIHFLYCENYTISGGRALRRYSDDDGITWSDPIDITAYTKSDYHNAFAFGPGHGIMTNDGTLIVPVWMVPKFYDAPIRAHNPSVLSTFYSKDNGETWAIGDILETNASVICPNETVAALTSDGRVYMNIRQVSYCRAKAYGKNGYSDWEGYAPDYALHDPGCFGSVVSYNDEKHPYTLIFANCAIKQGRTRVTVKVSFDDGNTYPISKLIDQDRGGYVEVAADNSSGVIYVIYENDWGKSAQIVRFDYDWLVNEKRTFL